MLAYVLLILVSLLVAVGVVWLWRLLSSQVVSLSNRVVYTSTISRLKTQRGFMSSSGPSRDSAKYKNRRNSKGRITAPWGW